MVIIALHVRFMLSHAGFSLAHKRSELATGGGQLSPFVHLLLLSQHLSC